MRKKAIWLLAILSAATVCFILYNGAQSIGESNGRSGVFTALIQAIIDPDKTLAYEDVSFFVRKAAHFIEYMILGGELAALCAAVTKGRFSYVSWSLFGVLGTAVVDEFIQYFVGRTSLLSDVVLDFCGGVTGICISWGICLFILRKKEQRK